MHKRILISNTYSSPVAKLEQNVESKNEMLQDLEK